MIQICHDAIRGTRVVVVILGCFDLGNLVVQSAKMVQALHKVVAYESDVDRYKGIMYQDYKSNLDKWSAYRRKLYRSIQ